MFSGVFVVPCAEITTFPEYVPAGSKAAFADTKTAVDVVPLSRSTVSQLLPAGVFTEAFT
jgi:hypothetical protein